MSATPPEADRKSTRLNSSHGSISYAVFCLKKKKLAAYGILNNKILSEIRKTVTLDEDNVCLKVSERDALALYFDIGCLINDTATTEIYTLSLHDALPI